MTNVTIELDGSDGFRLPEHNLGDRNGFAVSIIGDVNGDGFDDFAISAPHSNQGLFGESKRDFAGEVYVVYGGEAGDQAVFDLGNLDGSNGFTITGKTVNATLGRSVSGAGDINGDGLIDILIGSSDYGSDEVGGTSFVVFGSSHVTPAEISLADLDGSDGFEIRGAVAGDIAGRTVSDAGDINGDGIEDVLISAIGGPSYKAAVVFGSDRGFDASVNFASLDGTNGVRLDTADRNDNAGFSVSGAGDVNGDGYDDVILGAPLADPGGNRHVGSSFLLFGQENWRTGDFNMSSLDGKDGFRIDANIRSRYGNAAVSGIGDINGDGFDDVVVRAPYVRNEAGFELYSFSHVIFGAANGFNARMSVDEVDGSDGFLIIGIQGPGRDAVPVGSAGDFNGDGIDDLVVSDSGNGGKTFVVFGKTDGFAKEIRIFEEQPFAFGEGIELIIKDKSENSGRPVNGGGDINGDGFDDLIIGAYDVNSGFYQDEKPDESIVIYGFNSGQFDRVGDASAEAFLGNGRANAFALGGGDDTFSTGAGDDTVNGGGGDDSGVLGDGDDAVFAGAGDDVVKDQAGDDVLRGDAGDDRLFIGEGDDAAFGGAGDDRIYTTSAALNDRDIIDGGDGILDTLVLLDNGFLDLRSFDLALGVERIQVASGQDVVSTPRDMTFLGSAGDETFRLQQKTTVQFVRDDGVQVTQFVSGRFTVRARDGDDIVIIRESNTSAADNLDGGAGDDILISGSGADRLTGGSGFDKLLGGSHADTFVLAPGLDRDLIFDFTPGEDLLDVTAFGFTGFSGGLDRRIDLVNGKTVIDLAYGDRVILVGVENGTLDAADFIF